MVWINFGVNLGKFQAWSLFFGLNLGVWSWLDIVFSFLRGFLGGYLM